MKSSVFLTLSLCLTTICGDYLVFRSNFTSSKVLIAFTDNFVHAIVGALSSLIFFNYETNISREACLLNIIYCTVVSSFIDLDHFLVARSMQLKDLWGVKQRGIFHCSTFWLVLTAILFVYSNLFKKQNIHVAAWMIIIAFSTHHIRDANRRGMWVYPYGHTPPIPTNVYIFLTMLLPNVYPYLYFCLKPYMSKSTVINYTLIV